MMLCIRICMKSWENVFSIKLGFGYFFNGNPFTGEFIWNKPVFGRVYSSCPAQLRGSKTDADHRTSTDQNRVSEPGMRNIILEAVKTLAALVYFTRPFLLCFNRRENCSSLSLSDDVPLIKALHRDQWLRHRLWTSYVYRIQWRN